MTLKSVAKLAMLVISIAFALLISALGFGTHQPLGFGFGSSPSPSPAQINPTWSIGGLTILGVIISIVISSLSRQKQNSPIDIQLFLKALLYPQTFVALCISPVVLLGALSALDGKGLGPAVYLSAFQNGFFWQRVLSAKGP